jgi:hypothetical protein
MEKNYVYKVRANGVVYDNLASAIEDCVKSVKNYVHWRASKPIVVKVDGGYQVMITDIHGNVYKRGIDVFVPKHLVDKVDYYIDELRETGSCEDEDDDYEDDDYEDDDYEDDDYEDDDYEDDDYEDDDYEDEEDYEEEEDEPTQYCEQCDKECRLADIVNIDGFEMCKDCALEYIEDSY